MQAEFGQSWYRKQLTPSRLLGFGGTLLSLFEKKTSQWHVHNILEYLGEAEHQGQLLLCHDVAYGFTGFVLIAPASNGHRLVDAGGDNLITDLGSPLCCLSTNHVAI